MLVQFYAFNNPMENPYLYLSSGGVDPTKPLHQYGPAARSGYMIHYIQAGHGTFTSNHRDYHLGPGDMFFCEPGRPVNMLADSHDPWVVYWIRFTGKLVERLAETFNLSYRASVFNVRQAAPIRDQLLDIIAFSQEPTGDPLHYAAKLLDLIGNLRRLFPVNQSEERAPGQVLVDQGTQYMRNNFDTPISVADVADYLAIDRTYLFRLFKDNVGMSPKAYLTDYRMHAAQEMLAQTMTPIKVIARSCGYRDESQFSKAFQQRVGQSPIAYRRANKSR